jgi:hypothetical protein
LSSERLPPSMSLAPLVPVGMAGAQQTTSESSSGQQFIVGVPEELQQGLPKTSMGHLRWLRDFVRDSAKGGLDHTLFLIALGTCAVGILILTAIVAHFETVKDGADFAVKVILSAYAFYKSIYDKHQLDIAVLSRTRRPDPSLRLASIFGLFGSIAAGIYSVAGAGTSSNKLLLASSTFAVFAATYFLFKLVRIPIEIDDEIATRFPQTGDSRNDAVVVSFEQFKSVLDFAIESSGGDWYHTAVIVLFALGSLAILVATTILGNFEDSSHAATYVILVLVCLLAFFMALLVKHEAELKRFMTGQPMDRFRKFLIGLGIIVFIAAIVYAVFIQAASDKLLAASAAYQCLQSVYYAFKLVRIPKDLRVEVGNQYVKLRPFLADTVAFWNPPSMAAAAASVASAA